MTETRNTNTDLVGGYSAAIYTVQGDPDMGNADYIDVTDALASLACEQLGFGYEWNGDGEHLVWLPTADAAQLEADGNVEFDTTVAGITVHVAIEMP